MNENTILLNKNAALENQLEESNYKIKMLMGQIETADYPSDSDSD